MEIDETQALVIYTLLQGIEEAIKAGDADDAANLSRSARDVMTGLPIENERTKATEQ